MLELQGGCIEAVEYRFGLTSYVSNAELREFFGAGFIGVRRMALVTEVAVRTFEHGWWIKQKFVERLAEKRGDEHR